MDIKIQDHSAGGSFDHRHLRDQKFVKKMIKRDCPTVLVCGFSPCTAFSIANQGEIEPQVLAGAVEMIRFSMEICNLQHKAGRQLIFERPRSSRAWGLDEVVKMTYTEDATKTTFHQCMYGLEARDQVGSAPAYKPMSVLTNHLALAGVLQEKCRRTPTCPLGGQAGVLQNRCLPTWIV